jgi:hypothetical protein
MPTFVSSYVNGDTGHELYTFQQWSQLPTADTATAAAAAAALVAPARQKELCDQQDNDEASKLLVDLELAHDAFGAAWMLSNSFKGSASFLTYGENPYVTVSAAAVATNLRLRLLLPSQASPTADHNVLTQCMDCHSIEAPPAAQDGDIPEHQGAFDPRFHGLVCNQCQRQRIHRHNEVTRAVAAYCVRLFGNDKVSLAEADLNLPGCNRKADIRILTPTGYYFADIAVVHPACSKYANFGATKSSNTPMEAARRMYLKKDSAQHEQLRRHAARNGVFTAYAPPNKCFPIVFETSGNLLDESARHLYGDLPALDSTAPKPSVKSNFDWLLRRCRKVIAEANHEACLHFFRHSRNLLQQPRPEGHSSAAGAASGIFSQPRRIPLPEAHQPDDQDHRDAQDALDAGAALLPAYSNPSSRDFRDTSTSQPDQDESQDPPDQDEIPAPYTYRPRPSPSSAPTGRPAGQGQRPGHSLTGRR